MIKSDKWIIEMCRNHEMISPFNEKQIKESDVDDKKFLSYGVSSYGFDIRLGKKLFIFKDDEEIIDPKNFEKDHFYEASLIEDNTGKYYIIPPHSFALSHSVEYLKIPRNILVVCIGKSTYARCGLIVPLTPLEPEWEGIITLELSNTTHKPMKVYTEEGITQLLFFEGENCETSYKDRNGKYQNQIGITLPRA